MGPKPFIATMLAALFGATVLVAAAVVWFAFNNGPSPRLGATLSIGGLLLAALYAVAWRILTRKLIEPIRAITLEVETLTHTTQDRPPRLKDHLFPKLERSVIDLLQKLAATRAATDAAVRQATERAAHDRSRLEAILLDLSEGVIVCNRDHRILLYNPAAANLVRMPEALGLGRPLFGLLKRKLVMNALRPLLKEADANRLELAQQVQTFACSVPATGELLRARLRLIIEADNSVGGYVLSLDKLGTVWPLTEVLSDDLFRDMREELGLDGIELTQVGLPLQVFTDRHALGFALAHLLRRLAAELGIKAFDIEANDAGQRRCVEISWSGDQIAGATLTEWLRTKVPEAIGDATARDILTRQRSEVTLASGGDGRSMVRLTLPASQKPGVVVTPRLPPRPEFYDFDLFQAHPDETTEAAPLSRLRCVVFDTETTGLQPSAGDEIISIGAIAVVNGRILTGETFERLVNPQRDIPKASIKFHGITQDMIADKPPARIVLGQFKRFAASSVLVAHNAAFDMRFLELKQREAGVVFDNVVLDIMLLSAAIYERAEDHSLDGIARRLGVEINNRHTALGDAMATAAAFVALIEPLKARGIITLGDALRASRRAARTRVQQGRF